MSTVVLMTMRMWFAMIEEKEEMAAII